jgi:hypothetical protein
LVDGGLLLLSLVCSAESFSGEEARSSFAVLLVDAAIFLCGEGVVKRATACEHKTFSSNLKLSLA